VARLSPPPPDIGSWEGLCLSQGNFVIIAVKNGEFGAFWWWLYLYEYETVLHVHPMIPPICNKFAIFAAQKYFFSISRGGHLPPLSPACGSACANSDRCASDACSQSVSARVYRQSPTISFPLVAAAASFSSPRTSSLSTVPDCRAVRSVSSAVLVVVGGCEIMHADVAVGVRGAAGGRPALPRDRGRRWLTGAVGSRSDESPPGHRRRK